MHPVSLRDLRAHHLRPRRRLPFPGLRQLPPSSLQRKRLRQLREILLCPSRSFRLLLRTSLRSRRQERLCRWLSPLAEPVTPPSTPLPMPASEVPSAVPLAEPLIPPLPSPALSVAEPVAASPPLAVPVPVCPVCALPRTACGVYCESCGFLFPSDAEPAAEPPLATAAAPAAAARIRGRYELGERLTQRGSVESLSSPGPRHRRRGAGAGHRGARACAATGRIGSGCRTRLGAVGELDGGDRAWVRRASRPFSAGHRLPRGPAVLAEPGLGTEHSGGSSTSLSARGAGRIYRGGPRLPHRGTAHRNSPVGFLGRGGGLRGAALPLAPAHRRAAAGARSDGSPAGSRCGRTSSS